MSCVIRKQDFCLCENKGADQLRSNCEADQRLCFRYMDSTIPTHKSLAFFCDCTGRFVSCLVGNPEDWFSHITAQVIEWITTVQYIPHTLNNEKRISSIRKKDCIKITNLKQSVAKGSHSLCSNFTLIKV